MISDEIINIDILCYEVISMRILGKRQTRIVTVLLLFKLMTMSPEESSRREIPSWRMKEENILYEKQMVKTELRYLIYKIWIN